MPRSRFALPAMMSAAALVMPGAAQAQTVSMTGLVINLCVLTLSTPGTLGAAATGTTLATTEPGGIPALLTVVATGSSPTITFSPPAINGPSASGAQAEFAYSSPGGANRAFSGSSYVYVMNRLLDAVTIDGRATNAQGFSGGLYTLSATATCSQ